MKNPHVCKEDKMITEHYLDINFQKKENIFLPKQAVITEAHAVTKTEKYFRLIFRDNIPMYHQPGQIVEVSVFGYGEIPLGIASSPTRTEHFDLVVRKVGRVSTALWGLNKADTMYIRGPLGKGFPVEEMQRRDILIIAGGIGLVPTRSMIEYIQDKRDEFKRFVLFYGARTPEDQLFPEELQNWREAGWIEYHETVDKADDTWKGNTGAITHLFSKTPISKDTRVIICGPPIMYKFVLQELKKIHIPHSHIYVDLERRMKCGVGKCGHCQINGIYVCKEGPVFNYNDIKDYPEAF